MTFLPNSDTCYVCGQVNPFGLQVRFRLTEDGKVETTFTGDEHRCGFKGVVHGGVLSALLDETMGWAPAFHKRLFCYAAELRIRFQRPAPIGVPLFVTGWLEADKGRVWETGGEVRDAEGTVYAKGWGKYMPMTPGQTVDVIGYLHFDDETVPVDALTPPPAPPRPGEG